MGSVVTFNYRVGFIDQARSHAREVRDLSLELVSHYDEPSRENLNARVQLTYLRQMVIFTETQHESLSHGGGLHAEWHPVIDEDISALQLQTKNLKEEIAEFEMQDET